MEIDDVVAESSTAVISWFPVDDPNGLLSNYIIELMPLWIVSGSMNLSVLQCLNQLNRNGSSLITMTIDGQENSTLITDLSK